MEVKRLFTDDDAVSPVIGVILMVAITVILAAVIGAFVLGFGGGGPSAPSVQWDTSDNETAINSSNTAAVVFGHSGGDTISDPSTLQINGQNVNHYRATSSELTTGDAMHAYNDSDDTNTDYLSGEYTLVWNSPESDSTQELANHNV